jgi:hypothetical protein
MSRLAAQFEFSPAPDETVDDEYILLANRNVTIQIAPYAGGFTVNEHGGRGADFWLLPHGTHAALEDAQREAIKVGATAEPYLED